MSKYAYKFYADWCKPCRDVSPVIAGVFASHPELPLREVNVDLDPQFAYQHRVTSIPAILFFEDDKVIGRIDGGVTDAKLRSVIDELYGAKELTHDTA